MFGLGVSRIVLVVAAALAGPTVVVSLAHGQTHDAQGEPGETQEPREPVDVVVRGERLRAPVSSKDPTVASTVVERQALRRAGTTAASVVSEVAGVQVARSGAGSDLSTASVRGATSAQTPVLVAGVVINDDVAGTADLSTVPLWLLDRVEVFRGNAPLAAGQLGVGGAIWFEPRLPKRTELGFGLNAGSFGELSGWTAHALRAAGSASLIGIRGAGAKNDYTYVDDGGTRFDPSDDRTVTRKNADFTSVDAWAIGVNELGSGGRVTLITHAFEREQGVTGLAVIPARDARARYRRMLAALTASVPCSLPDRSTGLVSCRLTLSNSLVTANNHIQDPSFELGLQASRLSNQALRTTHRAQAEYDVSDDTTVAVDAAAASEQLAVTSSGPSRLRAERQTVRAAASVRHELGANLGAQVLAGAECHTTSAAGPSQTCGVFEPYGRLGLRWQGASWLTWVANVGRYVRVPTLAELYGTSAVVRGTSGLEAEKGVNVDTGVRAHYPGTAAGNFRGYAELFGFSRWVSDLIAFERTSFGVVRPFNVGQARVAGMEASATALVLNHIKATASATLLDPRQTGDTRGLTNRILPHRSRFILNSAFELYADKPFDALPVDRASAAVVAQHLSSRYADPAGLIVIAAHTTLDLEATVALFGETATLRGAVRNLFNQSSFDTVGYPLPGRSHHVSVECWF